MNKRKTLNIIRLRREKRARANIFGTAEKPRLSVFRSNRYTYAQLIDDEASKTLISVSSREAGKSKAKNEKSKVSSAERLGELLAEKAAEKGIKKAVFDRGKYKYHGRVKATAEGARKGGLNF